MDPEDFDDLFPFLNSFFPSTIVRMGADFAQDGILGNDSFFATNTCGRFEDNVYEGDENIDLEALHAFLLNPTEEFFNWENFIKPLKAPDLSFLMSTTITAARPLVPSEKPSPLASSVKYIRKAIFNKRICYVDPIPAYSIIIDQRNLNIDLTLYIFYKGTEEFRSYSGATTGYQNELHFDIANKYKALELTTGNPTFFYSFLRSLGLNEIRESLKTRLLELYRKLGRVDGEQVDWFYTIAPNFVLEALTKQQVWKDFQDLLGYQKSLWFSDSSSNLIKTIQLILNKEDGDLYLYDQFFANPAFIKSTYLALDGQDNYDGQLMTRKAIFAAILSAITFRAYAKREQPREAETSFTIGEFFMVDSNILDNNTISVDQTEVAFDLQQWEYQMTPLSNHQLGLSVQGGGMPAQNGRWVAIRPIQSLHPLALVELTLPKKDGTLVTRIATALEVKDLAHTAEWETVDQLFRTAINILTIAGSLTGIGAVGWLRVIAWVDIGLSTGDLIVQSLEKQLKDDPTGKAFLAAWKEIYDWGGLTTALLSAPDAIRSLRSLRIFRSTGTQILPMVSGPDLNLVKLALAQALAASGVLKDAKKLKISGDVLKEVANISIKTKALHRLEEATVLLVTGERKTGDLLHAIVHNGDIIFVTDDAALFGKNVNFLKNKTGSSLAKALDKVAQEGRRLDYLRLQKKGVSRYDITDLSRNEILKIAGDAAVKMSDITTMEAKKFIRMADPANKSNRIKELQELGARNFLQNYTLVAGTVHPNFPDVIITRTNYPLKLLDNYIVKKNKQTISNKEAKKLFKASPVNQKAEDVFKRVSDLYEVMKNEGYMTHKMHPRIAERIQWHIEARVNPNSVLYKSEYDWNVTGNIPGVHGEIIAINDLLWELEKKGFKLPNNIFEQLTSLNINLYHNATMARCGDCQLITKDGLFLEKRI